MISQTKINVAAMNSILDSLVDSESGGIVLCLPDCCIEDKILINCKDSFRNVSHLIEELDVSSNEFTFLGLDQIAEYLHEENCAITHLTVNNCQIISLIKLG